MNPERSISFRGEASRLTAVLLKRFGPQCMDLIEDSVQGALVTALRAWRDQEAPAHYQQWLTVVAKRLMLDALRRERRMTPLEEERFAIEPEVPGDEALELLLLCCHPKLSLESQIAITLREACGFSTAEVAASLLTSSEAVGQRLVRAKRTLRHLDPQELRTPGAQEMEALRRTIYLIFTRGYGLGRTKSLSSAELCEAAISLAVRLLQSTHGAEPETFALLALMLFQSSRFASRLDASGRSLLMDEQDRAAWDQGRIAMGFQALAASAEGDRLSTYHVEAAIAAEHAMSSSPEATNWERIVELYDQLSLMTRSKVVDLNRAIAIRKVRGPTDALKLLDALGSTAPLAGSPHLAAARADCLVDLNRHAEAREQLAQAYERLSSMPEKLLIEMKLERLK